MTERTNHLSFKWFSSVTRQIAEIMNRILRGLCFLIIVSLIDPIAVGQAKAFSNQQETDLATAGSVSSGIDLFVLIDQSESMLTSDPQNLRIDTAKYLVDFMSFYSLSKIDSTNRISIIGFGSKDKTLVMAPLTLVPLTNLGQTNPALDQIKEEIVGENLGKTNVVSALDLVQSQITASGDLGTDREHIILLITDGVPFDDTMVPSLTFGEHFESIYNKYNELKKFGGNWSLLVIGIDKQDSYWSKQAAPEWNKIATSAVRVQLAEEMKIVIVKNMGSLLDLSNQTYKANESIQVEPFTKYLQFSIFKYQEASISLSYEDPNGTLTEIHPDGNTVFQQISPGYELWVVANPPAGIWKVAATNNATVDIFKQSKFVSVQLTAPAANTPLMYPFHFEFTVPSLETNNTTAPISWHVLLIAPNGQELEVEMDDKPDQGRFHSRKYYQLDQIGDYQIHVLGTINSNPALPDIVVFSQEFSMNVYEIKVQLQEPAASVPLGGSIKKLKVQLLDKENNPISESDTLNLDAFIIPISQASPVKQSLDFDPVEKFFYTSFEKLPTNVEGKVDIQITGNVELDGVTISVFNKKLQYEVTAALPYFEIVSPMPTNNGQYSLFNGFTRNDFQIQVRWMLNNKPVDPKQIFVNPSEEIILVDIVGPKEITIPNLKLQSLDANDPSLWGATIPGLVKKGKYIATFRLQPTVLISSKQSYMAFEPIQVEFERTEGSLLPIIGMLGWTAAAALLVWLITVSYNYFVPPFPKGILTIKEQRATQGPARFAQLNLSKLNGRKRTWKFKDPQMRGLGILKFVISHVASRLQDRGGGIRIDAYGAKNKHLYYIRFDHGEMEKPLPGGRVGNSRFTIHYEPPMRTVRSSDKAAKV